MHKFDYSFLNRGAVNAQIASLNGFIGSLKAEAELKKTLFPKSLSKLGAIAKVASVTSSNAIEGIFSTDKRVAELLKKPTSAKGHDEKEILGYGDALSLIHSSYSSLDLAKEETLLSLSRLLFSHLPQNEGLASYKKDGDVILETSGDGSRKVRFVPTSAEETPQALEQWRLAYSAARNEASLDRFLLIPCVIFDFLCIHPFSDGNGRLSRLLSLLLLYQAGFDVGKYISFEEVIYDHRGMYDEALASSSVLWSESRNDYSPFIEDFLFMVFSCYKKFNATLLIVDGKKLNGEERVRKALANSFLPLSKSELAKMHPDLSLNLLELVLAKELKEGRIVKIGSFKDARYQKRDPLKK
jgi:Fic family protein